jgi:Uma2 family endonuclease
MTALKQPETLSIEEYLEGEEDADVRHEFLGGVVHAMAGGTNRHNSIATNALAFLHGKLREKTCQSFNSDTKVRIQYPDHTRFYYPDAMVVCRKNPETDHFQSLPDVVIEVLSESTRRTDMGEKKDAYFTIPSLKVLLLVDSEKVEVTAYRRDGGGGFRAELYEGLEEVVLLPEIDAELALGEIYERVEFGG